jgi:hypothetical protein
MGFMDWLKARLTPPARQRPETYYDKRPFANLSVLKPATLMLVSHYRGAAAWSFIGWGIRWITNSRVCHAMLYHGNGWITEAGDKGVIFRKIDSYLNAEAMIWCFDNPTLTDSQRVAICARARAFVGKPYDYRGVANFILHLPGHDNDNSSQFCSEHAVRSCAPDWLIAPPYFVAHPDEASPGVVFAWVYGMGRPPAELVDRQNVKA